jgi:hypothetical protein
MNNYVHDLKIYQKGIEITVPIKAFKIIMDNQNKKRLFIRFMVIDNNRFLSVLKNGKIFDVKYSVGGIMNGELKCCRLLKYRVCANVGDVGIEEVLLTCGLEPFNFT